MKRYEKAALFVIYIVVWLFTIFVLAAEVFIPYLNDIATPEQVELWDY